MNNGTKTIVIPRFEDCAFRVECLLEDASIKGNCSAIDEKTDAEIEAWIVAQLESGNPWAWCCVKVTCYYDNGLKGISGRDYLGCCSYKSEEDFTNGGDYFEDMKQEAYADFLASIEAL